MKGLLAALVGLIIASLANPATAYLVNVTTSIPVASAGDYARFERAVDSAIDDVLRHAIGFVPTVVTVQKARVMGDRIYILLLIADEDGEETIKRMSVDGLTSSDPPVKRPPQE